MKKTRLIFLLIIVAVAIAACGSPQEVELTPQEIVEQSVAHMLSLQGYQFLIEPSGPTVYLDESQGISFLRTQGHFVAPDKLRADVRAMAIGIIVDVEVISVGGELWQTNFLTGGWELLSPQDNFDPIELFKPDSGILSILSTELLNIELVGEEELEEMPGLALISYLADLAGENINKVSYGMIGSEELVVQLWLDTSTSEIHRLIITDPMDDGEDQDTVWQIDFWDFDGVTVITAPE